MQVGRMQCVNVEGIAHRSAPDVTRPEKWVKSLERGESLHALSPRGLVVQFALPSQRGRTSPHELIPHVPNFSATDWWCVLWLRGILHQRCPADDVRTTLTHSLPPVAAAASLQLINSTVPAIYTAVNLAWFGEVGELFVCKQFCEKWVVKWPIFLQ